MLLGPVAAAKLYRKDDRTPAEVKAAGGLMSWNPRGTWTVIQHAISGDDKETMDPRVSTTTDQKLAASGATSPGEVYVYYINPTGLSIKSVAKEFKKAKKVDPHPGEKEYSVHGSVPWVNIISWDTYKMSRKVASTTREEYDAAHHKARSLPQHPRDFLVMSQMGAEEFAS